MPAPTRPLTTSPRNDRAALLNNNGEHNDPGKKTPSPRNEPGYRAFVATEPRPLPLRPALPATSTRSHHTGGLVPRIHTEKESTRFKTGASVKQGAAPLTLREQLNPQGQRITTTSPSSYLGSVSQSSRGKDTPQMFCGLSQFDSAPQPVLRIQVYNLTRGPFIRQVDINPDSHSDAQLNRG